MCIIIGFILTFHQAKLISNKKNRLESPVGTWKPVETFTQLRRNSTVRVKNRRKSSRRAANLKCRLMPPPAPFASWLSNCVLSLISCSETHLEAHVLPDFNTRGGNIRHSSSLGFNLI